MLSTLHTFIHHTSNKPQLKSQLKKCDSKKKSKLTVTQMEQFLSKLILDSCKILKYPIPRNIKIILQMIIKHLIRILKEPKKNIQISYFDEYFILSIVNHLRTISLTTTTITNSDTSTTSINSSSNVYPIHQNRLENSGRNISHNISSLNSSSISSTSKILLPITNEYLYKVNRSQSSSNFKSKKKQTDNHVPNIDENHPIFTKPRSQSSGHITNQRILHKLWLKNSGHKKKKKKIQIEGEHYHRYRKRKNVNRISPLETPDSVIMTENALIVHQKRQVIKHENIQKKRRQRAYTTEVSNYNKNDGSFSPLANNIFQQMNRNEVPVERIKKRKNKKLYPTVLFLKTLFFSKIKNIF